MRDEYDMYSHFVSRLPSSYSQFFLHGIRIGRKLLGSGPDDRYPI